MILFFLFPDLKVGAIHDPIPQALIFIDKTIVDYQTAAASNPKRFGTYFRKMLDLGIYLAPSQFEASFVSIAHTTEDIDKTIAANREALRGAFA
jgi:glutamate-1-semialdehyde 2,1-aminomutase